MFTGFEVLERRVDRLSAQILKKRTLIPIDEDVERSKVSVIRRE